MIKYIIIEDEPAALRRLKRLVTQLRKDWLCVGTADSISTAKKILKTQEYDLILSDIELSDGTSFELFDSEIKTPIIFITAYDAYAIKAFDFNSIYYLLKPINEEKLNIALTKFERHPSQFNNSKIISQANHSDLSKTIISRIANKSTLIHIDQIAYCYSEKRTTKAFLFSGKFYHLDQSLETLNQFLPSQQFFKINRQAILNKAAVIQFTRIASNRLLIKIELRAEHELIVSKEKSKPFKEWLED